MLQSLRKAANTWAAKLLLIVMVFAFGIWGVHASMFAGSASAVVTVGDQKVSDTEFRIAFNNVVTMISRQFGTQLTLEQAKMFGAEQMVYGRLVSGAALDQLASDMKLGLSEDRILTLIQQEPAFRDPTSGGFSRDRMMAQLEAGRIRQEDYLNSVTQQAVRTQIVDAVSDGFSAPKTLLDALKAYGSESRDLDYLILGSGTIDAVKPPSDDELAKWFEANKANYKAPEYRKFSYVKLEPSDIAEPSAISDEAIKEDYEKRKANYRTPETRTIEQLAFPDKAAAEAAAAKLGAGTTFDQLVTEQGKTASDVLLGDFRADSMPTKAMADAAFSVKADGGTTPVTEGLIGPVILRVTNIRPEVVKSLDEVKDDIRKELALALANDEIENVYKSFEDVRASGASLAESAQQQKLKVETVDAVDSEGKDMKGEAVKDLPTGRKLINEVFQSEVGVEPLPLTLDNGGYVWFELLDVVPARDRKLDEVKDKVLADWTAEQQKLALVKKAEAVVAEVKGGKALADVAAGLKLAVESKAGIRRGAADAVLGTDAVSAAFDGPKGYVTHAATEGGATQIVLVVKDVNENAPSDALENNDQQIKDLAANAGQDILNQMIGELQVQYGVSFNRTRAEQLMIQR
ncbi:MAG: SurA N-terminal domain-containing protein [Rhizobiaceae bacterium]|nr:SurA N-terminal domain-containing protein [Rhizobiaceae bacterium]